MASLLKYRRNSSLPPSLDVPSPHQPIPFPASHSPSAKSFSIEPKEQEGEESDDEPQPLQPRPPTGGTLLFRRSNRISVQSSATFATSATMSTVVSSYRQPPQEDAEFGSESWQSTDSHAHAKDDSRAYTSDLADFLRSTGPDAAPSPSPAPISQPVSSKNFLKKYLKKRNVGGSDSKVDKQTPPSSFGSTIGSRRFTAGSVGTAVGVAAINKALHQVPPPNVEPKVFANGQTIYMINSRSGAQTGSVTSLNASVRIPPKPIRPTASFSGQPQPNPPALLRPSSSSNNLGVPRHTAPRTLTPITSDGDYDIQFDSTSSAANTDRENAADTSDVDPSIRRPESIRTTKRSSHRKSTSTEKAGTKPPTPQSVKDKDSVWVSRDLAAARNLVVTRDRSGSEHVPPSPRQAYERRDRSASMIVRSSSQTNVGLGLSTPPPTMPPPGPPPLPPKEPESPARLMRSPSRPESVASKVSSPVRRSRTRPSAPQSAPSGSPRVPLRPLDASPVAGNTLPQPPSFATPTIIPYKRRGSAPEPHNPNPTNLGPLPPLPTTYVFPAPQPPSESQSEEDVPPAPRSTKHSLSKMPSHSSIFLEKQLEDVMKMNDMYLERAVAAKRRHAEERERERERERPRTSQSSGHSGASSNISVGAVAVAVKTSGPPKLPLPPSPVVAPGSSPTAGSFTVVGSPALSPVTSIGSTSASREILQLNHALHTSRSRYESLAAHMIQMQASWEEQRAAFEIRLTDLERTKSLEQEQYEKRIEECERALTEKEQRIAKLEEERFAWERERKGLRWLLRGQNQEEAAAPDASGLVIKTSDSEGTIVEEPAPSPTMTRNTLSSVTAVSVSRPGSTGSLMDDHLLHPKFTPKQLKRHSMFEHPSSGTAAHVGKRPLSAAMDDILLKVRNLAVAEVGKEKAAVIDPASIPLPSDLEDE